MQPHPDAADTETMPVVKYGLPALSVHWWMSWIDRILREAGKKSGVPSNLFVAGVMTTENSPNKLLFTAGLMDKHGASFEG